ncbi:transposase [Metabacillus dongyingensis]|uniref:transposase n=1 Tax=Metabacillus dongyingensis TaxID=2874282 RepID=UPI003B8D1A8D
MTKKAKRHLLTLSELTILRNIVIVVTLPKVKNCTFRHIFDTFRLVPSTLRQKYKILRTIINEIYSNKYNDSFLQYHIAFFTKNTLKLHEINFIKNYLKSVSLRHEFKIMKLEFGVNNVRLIINCKTTHYIPNLIKALKGGSARFLYKEFPDSKTEMEVACGIQST